MVGWMFESLVEAERCVRKLDDGHFVFELGAIESGLSFEIGFGVGVLFETDITDLDDIWIFEFWTSVLGLFHHSHIRENMGMGTWKRGRLS